MATLVPDKLTQLTLEEAIRAFADGWSVALGWDPKARQLAILVAHVVLENGAEFKALHNYGFGNVKANPEWPGKYSMYRCNEVINGKVVWFDPPNVACWFRAYDTAEEGAIEHVKFLSGVARYHLAWAELCGGDAVGFVHELRNAGYFTGPEDSYARAVASIANRIGPACDKILNDEHHGIDDGDREHIAQQVALWLDGQARGAEPFPLPEDT